MKTKLITATCCLLFACHSIQSNAQANRALSNLNSPTAVNQDLLPNTDSARNLGSKPFSWKNLYLDGPIFSSGQRVFKSNAKLFNLYVGGDAGNANSGGTSNTGLGYNTLFNNSSASFNTAIGDHAMFSNTFGGSNIAIGSNALYSNTTTCCNVAVGVSALKGNTSGSYNAVLGIAALELNTGGSDNVAVGAFASFENGTGGGNTAVGYESQYFNQTGSSNTSLGDLALNYNSSGSSNTAVGAFAGPGFIGSYNNTTALGYGASVSADNTVRIGNSSVTSIGGYANWSNISDGRVKKDIKQNVPGLAFIDKLTPITYHLDLDAIDKITQHVVKDKDGNILQPSQTELNTRKQKEQVLYTGFVAQDVEKVAKELNYDFSGVDAAKNDKDLYALRYSDFVVPLVKAVQELSKMNSDKDAKIDTLQKQINELRILISQLSANIVNSQVETSIAANSNAVLSQNVPNPFTSSTIIHFTLPQKFSTAYIVVTDQNGNSIKKIDVSNGKNFVQVDGATLSSGSYHYSLYADGKLIDSKQMISVK